MLLIAVLFTCAQSQAQTFFAKNLTNCKYTVQLSMAPVGTCTPIFPVPTLVHIPDFFVGNIPVTLPTGSSIVSVNFIEYGVGVSSCPGPFYTNFNNACTENVDVQLSPGTPATLYETSVTIW